MRQYDVYRYMCIYCTHVYVYIWCTYDVYIGVCTGYLTVYMMYYVCTQIHVVCRCVRQYGGVRQYTYILYSTGTTYDRLCTHSVHDICVCQYHLSIYVHDSHSTYSIGDYICYVWHHTVHMWHIHIHMTLIYVHIYNIYTYMYVGVICMYGHQYMCTTIYDI